MNRWVRYLYAIVILAALTMAGAGFSLLTNLHSETEKIQQNFRDNPTGVAAQADYELLTLIDKLERFGKPTQSTSHQEVIDWFDILWSRQRTNSSGATGEYYMTLAGAEKTVDDLQRTLAEIEATVLNLAPGDTANASEVAAILREFVPRIHSVTLAATSTSADFVAGLQSTQKRAQFWTIVFLPGMLIAGFAMAGLLWLERRRLNLLNRTLEYRVGERTSEILWANERLKDEIEDRQRIAQTLRERGERFRDITSNVPGIVYQFKIDSDGKTSFPYVSATVEPMLDLAAMISSPILMSGSMPYFRTTRSSCATRLRNRTELLDRGTGKAE